jgi:hypothetical protein
MEALYYVIFSIHFLVAELNRLFIKPHEFTKLKEMLASTLLILRLIYFSSRIIEKCGTFR